MQFVLVIVVGVMIVTAGIAGLSLDRGTVSGPRILDARQQIIEAQRKTVESMDKTIRAQWEVERILRRRLGEPISSPPVSITGLPDPKEE